MFRGGIEASKPSLTSSVMVFFKDQVHPTISHPFKIVYLLSHAKSRRVISLILHCSLLAISLCRVICHDQHREVRYRPQPQEFPNCVSFAAVVVVVVAAAAAALAAAKKSDIFKPSSAKQHAHQKRRQL